MVVPLASVKASVFGVPGTASLRSSLLRPSACKRFAMSAMLSFGETSNAILAQAGLSPFSSTIASWPVGVARNARLRLARHQPEPDHLPVIVDLPVEVGGGEGGMADPLGLDHGRLICTSSITVRSVDRDVARLHHRRPSGLALLGQFAHLLRRAAERVGFEPQNARLQVRLPEALPDRVRNLLGDVLRRAGRSRHRHPGDRRHAGQAFPRSSRPSDSP